MNTTTTVRGTFLIDHNADGGATIFYNFRNGDQTPVLNANRANFEKAYHETNRLQNNAHALNIMADGDYKSTERAHWVEELKAFAHNVSADTIKAIAQDFCPASAVESQPASEEVTPDKWVRCLKHSLSLEPSNRLRWRDWHIVEFENSVMVVEYTKTGAAKKHGPFKREDHADPTQAAKDYVAQLTNAGDTVPSKTVTIPARKAHEGIAKMTVTLPWVCPKCGGPRGDVVATHSFDGSRRLVCDGWSNPCGHVDFYEAVRAEAANSNALTVTTYFTEGDEPVSSPMLFEEFIDLNDMDEEEAVAILTDLFCAGKYVGGGGAAPEWVVCLAS